LICVALSNCASVQSQGKYYFVNKTERELIKYFGYDGSEMQSDVNNEYDKILFFTNEVDSRYMNKTTVTTFKTSTNQNIYSLNYSEHNDGCLVNYESGYYHYRPGSYSTGKGGVKIQHSPPQHRNDNSFIRTEINRFNSEIKRLNAAPSDNQQAAFNNTPIGSWYFVYSVTQEYGSRNYPQLQGVNEGIPLSETFAIYHCNIWRVNVNADNRSSTETYIAYTYDYHSQQYYDENNNVINESEANSNENYYTQNGFIASTQTRGLSVLAFINNGKIVKVE
jgi:hypothetical protein